MSQRASDLGTPPEPAPAPSTPTERSKQTRFQLKINGRHGAALASATAAPINQHLDFEMNADGSFTVAESGVDVSLAVIPSGATLSKAVPTISKSDHKIVIEGHATAGETLTVVIRNNATGAIAVNRTDTLPAGDQTYTSPTLADGTYTVTLTDVATGTKYVQTITIP